MKEEIKNNRTQAHRNHSMWVLFDLDSWQEIWITITHNKLRSLLTAFGIFWGIFMLMVMVGLGMGILNFSNASFGHVSANTSLMFTNQTTIPYQGFQKVPMWYLTTEDQKVLKNDYKEIRYLTGFLFGGYNINNVVRNDKMGSFQIIGLEPQYNQIIPNRILEGRYLNEIDILESRKVCVIGLRVVNDLFVPGEKVIGSLIRVSNIYYTVVGVMEPYSENVSMFGPTDKQINVPITTLQRSMNRGNKIDGLAMTAYDDIKVGDLEQEVMASLKRRHHVSPEDIQAMDSFNLEQVFSTFNMLGVGLTVLIWIVGLGTLLAGLIGVSNIMLVTVRERTQEIGVRRALGATPRVILTQILSESIVLTTLAGVLGITAGTLVLAGISSMIPPDSFMQNPQITFSIAIIALVILIVSGLLAGILPAKRALQIKAIEALRDE